MTEQKAIPETPRDMSIRRDDRRVGEIRGLIEREEFSLWIAQALFRKPAVLAPLGVERGETLEDNLRRAYEALTPTERGSFRAAITRAIKEFWETKTASPALALRDVFRLARLSGHYGLLPWLGRELDGQLRQPKTTSELKILSEIVASMGSAEQWIPEEQEDDLRFILGKLNELFRRVGDRKSLSFLDAAFLVPAVRYSKDSWVALLCLALQRYDIRATRVFPEEWPTFGGASRLEGTGLYDFRAKLSQAISELTLFQFCSGVRMLVDKIKEGDDPSSKFLQILLDEGLLVETREVVTRFPQAVFPFINVVEPARIFFFGPAYLYAVQRSHFRFVTGADLDEWQKYNWAVATYLFDQSLQIFERVMRFNPIAMSLWPAREVNVSDLPPTDEVVTIEKNLAVRDFSVFRTRGAPSIIKTSLNGQGPHG